MLIRTHEGKKTARKTSAYRGDRTKFDPKKIGFEGVKGYELSQVGQGGELTPNMR
jgi:hypothetical protein